MAHPAVPSIVLLGIDTVQLAHAAGEIALRRRATADAGEGKGQVLTPVCGGSLSRGKKPVPGDSQTGFSQARVPLSLAF